MDAPAFSGMQLSPHKTFDQVLEVRAEKHEHLRGRNNVTSCRSPTRGFDTKQIKNDLKEKRHKEFLRRRSLSPELCVIKPVNYSSRTRCSAKTFSRKHGSSSSELKTLHTNVKGTLTANGHPVMISPQNRSKLEAPVTSQWATTITLTKESNQHKTRSSDQREDSTYAHKTNLKTFMHTGKVHQNVYPLNESIFPKVTLQDAGVQTESGLITVKESDVQRLADYMQEALWREEAMKKKLEALQESVSNLMNSSDKIQTTRFSEDLLKNKIKALEAQLQACLQKFPKDGVKKLVVQMEKQKLIYEEKALAALQKATQEKTEALVKAETLQEALITANAEGQRLQSLYEELKMNSEQLRQNQHHCNEQLQQLHCQVELSRAREAELREEVVSLRREKKELEYSISLVEEDNQILREELQHLRDGSNESQNFIMQGGLTSEEAEKHLTARRDSQVDEQLRHTQETLRLKERECEELQTELQAMEQECQSSQARLSQCRDELRQLHHRHKRTTLCGSWRKVFVFFLLLFAAAGVVMLWLWHPPFREQVEDLYSDIETRIENYLMEMASPQHSGCFRPI